MAIRGYSTFPKLQDTHGGESYPSKEIQLAYSIALANWVRDKRDIHFECDSVQSLSRQLTQAVDLHDSCDDNGLSIRPMGGLLRAG